MNKLEFVKNPVIAEFLGYSLDDSFTETELESSIINNLQKFLMDDKNNRNFSQVTAFLGVGKKGKMKYNKKMDNI